MSTPSFAFPESLAENYRPQHIGEFAGLEKQRKILGKLAAHPYPSAWLFVGPPGVGKTSMALALAVELRAENCPNLKRLVADTRNNVRESLMRLELELMGA